MEAGDRRRLIEIRSAPQVQAWWSGDDLDQEFTANLADVESTRLVIEIDRSATGRSVIGLIQYAEEEDPEFRHASVDIYLDPTVHRRGHATDAIRTVLAHLVDDLGHHRVTIDPTVANRGAIECYRRVGFREVGVMQRYQRLADGTWADALLMEFVAGTV